MDIDKLLIIPNVKDIETSIRIASEYGCGFEYNDFFLPDILDDEGKVNSIIKQYKTKTGIPDYSTFHGAFLDVTIFSQDRRIFEVSDLRVEQSIAIAREMGASAIVFHTNYIPNFMQQAYREKWVESNVKYWSEKLDKYPDISIYIENMFDTDWELLLKLGEGLKQKDNFGICFDYAHACVFGDEAQVDEWSKRLGPYVKHVHINDNNLIEDLHQAIGTGRVDWIGFKKNYEAYFPKASVLVEMNRAEDIRSSLEFLKNL